MRITNRKFIAFFALTLAICASVNGQYVDSITLKNFKPEFRRQLNHDNIDKAQQNLLKIDGKNDNWLEIRGNEDASLLITRVVRRDVDELQYLIDRDSTSDHRLKVNYLMGLQRTLEYLKANWYNGQLNVLYTPSIIKAFKNSYLKDKNGESIASGFINEPSDMAKTILAIKTFEKNPGYTELTNYMVWKYCEEHPSRVFQILSQYPDVPFADSLIKVASPKYTSQLYNHAQAWGSKLGTRIRAIQDDKLITTVVKMAQNKSGQQFFPFLDNVLSGKVTIEELDSIQYSPLAYYKMLVKTQMDYYERLSQHGDTARNFKQLTARLSKEAKDEFITTINGLHAESDAVRFRCIQPLTAPELFYLSVLSDGLIYTSSYTNGVYPLMMSKMKNRGDSLLLTLHFDHYRKFIAQAAAYNTLGGFLASFPNPENARDLMKAFVGGLERTEGLEDGVDVADSYASIYENNPKLAKEVLYLVKQNYQKNERVNNTRGVILYNILNQLFLSADEKNKIDLTKELGIPPVYSVPYADLQSPDSTVNMQVFFYGDKDGQNIFNGFLKMFGTGNWSIDGKNKNWVLIKSTRGKRVHIYANRALDEETGQDEIAQAALSSHLDSLDIHPSITIHRGHSYYADATISQMSTSSKIVFMGSCGGFHLIDAILKRTSDAHIIASKQIGKTAINRPFFELLMEEVRNGKSIDWIPFWKEFKSRAKKDGFEDYIPPYKNLGAIFVKAYKIALGNETEE